jgi:hypothetical protein
VNIKTPTTVKTNETGYVPDYSIHKGIVIDTNDPIQGGGRVQVYIPDIHGINLFSFLNSKNQAEYPTIGDNVGSLNKQSTEYLKTFCPWADICSPILTDMGPGTTGDDGVFDFVAENNARKYEGFKTPFAEPHEYLLPRGNPFAYATVPSYDKAPSGTFGVPRIGAQVLLLFYKGDCNFPVCIGGINGVPAFTQIFALDGSFQNAANGSSPKTSGFSTPTTSSSSTAPSSPVNTPRSEPTLPPPISAGTPPTPLLPPIDYGR